MRQRVSLSLLSATLVAACHGTTATTPAVVERIPAGDWPSYGRTVSGNRFSPPTQIDRANVAHLQKLPVANPILAGVTPTAGGLVFAADLGGHVYAFDAESGNVLWETDTGQSIGGGVVAYLARERELIGIVSGMRSPTWAGGAQQSRIVVYGLK